MKLLVCGTRGTFKDYRNRVFNLLDLIQPDEIIEGCCPNSADQYAEEWAQQHNIRIQHYPSTSGNYLKRNIEMVTQADQILAFWNKFSYGTSQAIASATQQGKKATIVMLVKK
jgi:hypothetical protein